MGTLLLASIHVLAEDNGKKPAHPSAEPASPVKRPANSSGKIDILIAKLADKQYGVRSSAFESLAQFGVEALEPLRAALDSKDPEVRARAAELLIRIRGRGFLGIGLSEDWDGERPNDHVNTDALAANRPDPDEEDAEDAEFVRAPPIVQVTQVIENFPAKRAGISTGDRILAVNGQSIHGMYDLMRVVILAGPKQPTMLVIEREGKKQTLSVELSRNPNDPPPPVDLLGDQAAPTTHAPRK